MSQELYGSTELISLLNELLESERAGAQADLQEMLDAHEHNIADANLRAAPYLNTDEC